MRVSAGFVPNRKMSRKSLWVLLVAVLAAACGQSPADSCPVYDRNECVPPAPSYDGGIGELLNQRCMPCHGDKGIEAKHLLTDYAHVTRELMGIGNQLVTCSMPPAGNPQLTTAEREQILNWLSCAAPK
jgi:hypothetical protein